jgi:GDPmannose 4,6-dehydratase
MTTRKVLITGISGFVGPYLAQRLLSQGSEVVGLVTPRADNQKPKRLIEMGLESSVRLISGDITNLSNLISVIHEVQPDWIFHLAAQSFVPESFRDPLGTFKTNCAGTQNILESVRLRVPSSKIIFAGSSEEYGLQFYCNGHVEQVTKKYGVIEPPPEEIPEIPIDEQSFMRPMSPYATSKVYGDFAFRNYHMTYGMHTVVSRAFNHEGAGRGHNFVTSTIVRQLVSMHLEEQYVMKIGDVQSFRDWSHVLDIVEGYILLAERAASGSVYVQGSMRSNSVLSYILYTLRALGYEIQAIYNINGEKRIKDPLASTELKIGNASTESNVLDETLLSNKLTFDLNDVGIIIETNKRKFKIEFDPLKFRPSDVPVLLANTNKIKKLGFTIKKSLMDIINDQINYYLDPVHRNNLLTD